MSASTRWVCWLYWKKFSERSYYRYLWWLFLSQHNAVVSPSLLLVIKFLIFFLPHGWVRPLVEIADYIRTSFMSNHIIAIYHHCFSLSTIVSFHCHHCLLIYFESFLWILHTYECDHSLGLLITLEVLCWAIVLFLYIIIFFSQCNGVVSTSPLLIVIYSHNYFPLPTNECDHLLGWIIIL